MKRTYRVSVLLNAEPSETNWCHAGEFAQWIAKHHVKGGSIMLESVDDFTAMEEYYEKEEKARAGGSK